MWMSVQRTMETATRCVKIHQEVINASVAVDSVLTPTNIHAMVSQARKQKEKLKTNQPTKCPGGGGGGGGTALPYKRDGGDNTKQTDIYTRKIRHQLKQSETGKLNIKK